MTDVCTHEEPLLTISAKRAGDLDAVHILDGHKMQ